MGCCGNSNQNAVYEYDNKKRLISKKNQQTLERYGQGVAARNYTKNMKYELIREIAQQKKPCYKEGIKRSVDSSEVLITDKELEELLSLPENSNLTWNNYFEDIGDGRQYKGQWIRKQDFVTPMDTKRKADNVDQKAPEGQSPGTKQTSKTQWRGLGTIQFPDGAKYCGQTENGQFNGRGVMTHANGDIYFGQWRDGKAHGEGVFCDNKGSLYEGEWANDLQHGKGRELWNFGAIVYEGDFQQGQKSGKGKFEFEGSKYEGDFLEGQFHGDGKYYFADSGKIYTGQFKDNQMEGKGVIMWPDQSKYEGDFVQGKMHGQGVRHYPNGNIYKGEWVEDKPHGEGTIYKAKEGTWKEGNFNEGKLEKHWQVSGVKVQGSIEERAQQLAEDKKKTQLLKKALKSRYGLNEWKK